VDAAPLIGRTEAMAAVRSAVTRVAGGRGGVLLVVGEAGVGKSRLLAEAGRLARDHRVDVLCGQARESGGAYRPLIEALLRGGADDLDPETVPAPYRAALGLLLPAWPGGAGSGPESSVDPVLVLGEAVVRVLDALVGGPCLLVLDDLQWADADTVALLQYLADRLRDLPVLVVASARDDEPGSAAVDRLTTDPAVGTVVLARLSPAELGALAAARAGGRLQEEELAALAARADGLPLLAEELVDDALRAAAAPPSTPVPRTMTALVRRRLSFLDPAAVRCLRAAAVTGTDPDWRLLPAVVGQPEDAVLAAVRAAADARLLREDAGRLRWRHALMREAVLAELLPPERAALARRVAEALLARGRPEDAARAAERRVVRVLGQRRRQEHRHLPRQRGRERRPDAALDPGLAQQFRRPAAATHPGAAARPAGRPGPAPPSSPRTGPARRPRRSRRPPPPGRSRPRAG
jgi:AAA ATPase domain